MEAKPKKRSADIAKKKKKMEAKPKNRSADFEKKKMEAKRREEYADRAHFAYCIQVMEEYEKEYGYGEVTKELPRSRIVNYPEFLEKLWGWDRLVPKGRSVSWSEYSAYIEEYHRRNVDAVRSIAAPAETCMIIQKQLVSVWKTVMKSPNKVILPVRKSLVLSCLINERARSDISQADRSFSDVSAAAWLCITKEGDLTRELLRCGADPVDDYLIDQGREICICALSLMKCHLDNSVAAFAALLGMAKEAEMMCSWMSKNNKLVDFDDDLIPDEIVESRTIRYKTLNFMINTIGKSSSSAAAGRKIDKDKPASRNGPGDDGIAVDEASTTSGVGISDVLDPQCKNNITGGERSKSKEDLLEKLWGWERLLPLFDFKWSDYSSYLEEYYRCNADKFVAGVAASQNPEDPQIATYTANMGVVVTKFCLKMEKKLLSKWKTRVRHSVDDTFPFSTYVLSSLIKEFALTIRGIGDELCLRSAVAFVCITMEAGLMCELLKHGAKASDDIIQQSSVIRMCAFGLVNLKGQQSFAPAAAMLGMANEAKKMCDWMKRENKLFTFSLCESHELEEFRLIRIKALHVMTSILHESSFPG